MDQEKWGRIEVGFRQHFENEMIDQRGDELISEFGGSSLMVSKSGTAEASIPLHSFIAEEFSDIRFGEEKVKIVCRDVIYEFRS